MTIFHQSLFLLQVSLELLAPYQRLHHCVPPLCRCPDWAHRCPDHPHPASPRPRHLLYRRPRRPLHRRPLYRRQQHQRPLYRHPLSPLYRRPWRPLCRRPRLHPSASHPSSMSTIDVLLHPARHPSPPPGLGLLLDAPAWFPLHRAMSRVALHCQQELSPSRPSPTLMAWRPARSLGIDSLALLYTPRLCPLCRGPVGMLLPILIGVGPWKKNLPLSWTTILGI